LNYESLVLDRYNNKLYGGMQVNCKTRFEWKTVVTTF